jgi:two-component system KDP operon response regulator KdpE
MTTVLVVDDEPRIRRALEVNLLSRGYGVVSAASGPEALEMAADSVPDLVVLDLGLPGMDGTAVIRELRTWSRVPIVVLSVRGEERDKVAALDAGADDYVTKPFGVEELLARLRAAERRAPELPGDPTVDTGDFHLDLATHVACVGAGRESVHLTPIEWRLVEQLVAHPGSLVGRTELLAKVWGPEYTTETNYLRVHMANLRRKLEPEPSRPRYFLTEAGMGYRFQP